MLYEVITSVTVDNNTEFVSRIGAVDYVVVNDEVVAIAQQLNTIAGCLRLRMANIIPVHVYIMNVAI